MFFNADSIFSLREEDEEGLVSSQTVEVNCSSCSIVAENSI